MSSTVSSVIESNEVRFGGMALDGGNLSRQAKASGVWLSDAPVLPPAADSVKQPQQQQQPSLKQQKASVKQQPADASPPLWSHLAPDHAYRRRQLKCPCPALATMINHGYLRPQSANERLSFFTVISALMACYNIDWILATFLCLAGAIICGNFFGFSMSDLAVHGRIEHDASLSRPNQSTGLDWRTPNEKRIERLFALCKRDGVVTQQDFAVIRCVYERELEKEVSWLKDVWRTFFIQTIGRAEVALITMIFTTPEERAADDNVGVRSDWVSTWLREERLPDDWQRPAKPVHLLHVRGVAMALKKRIEVIRAKDPQMNLAACPYSYQPHSTG